MTRGMAGRCGPWRGVGAPIYFEAVRQAMQQAQRQAQQQAQHAAQHAAQQQAASSPPASFVPPVDIYEDAQSIVLHLEVPGISEADIKIQMEATTLEVSGERKLAQGQNRESFRRMERTYGSFKRVFRVPTNVQADAVTANYANGVLSITLSKKPESPPKTIPVTRA